jgi:hypothetical protein
VVVGQVPPVREVTLDAEGGHLHGSLNDEYGGEEVVENLQGIFQLLRPDRWNTSKEQDLNRD